MNLRKETSLALMKVSLLFCNVFRVVVVTGAATCGKIVKCCLQCTRGLILIPSHVAILVKKENGTGADALDTLPV